MNCNAINQFFDHIYVITLEREFERQELLEKCLEGINYSLFFGIDKKDLVLDDLIDGGIYDEEKAIRMHHQDKPMNTGQIGRSWSHRLVYEDMLKNKFKKVLILEDEVIPNREGFTLLVDSLNQIPNDWDVLYLDCSKNLTRNIGTWFSQLRYHILHFFRRHKWNHTVINNLYARKFSDNLLIAGMHDCSNAYAISHNAAKKLVELQTPICFLSNGLLAYACTNKLVKAFVFQPNAFQKHEKLKAKTLID